MNPCLHRKNAGAGLVWCDLLNARLPLSSASVSCESCCQRWKGNEPASAEDIVFASPSANTHTTAKLEILYNNDTVGPFLQHPDHCLHHPKTLNYNGCCSQRTWSCPLHGVVDLQTCRTCPDFVRDE